MLTEILPTEYFMDVRKSLILQGNLSFLGIVTKIWYRLVNFEENPAVERFSGN